MRILTGIKPTGDLHLGNYIGAIKQVEDLSLDHDVFLFVADLHALNGGITSTNLKDYTNQLLAALYAFFKDNKNVRIYLQSQITQTFELETILGNYTSKGLLNRAHAYKAKVDSNIASNKDIDYEVNMGLFNYPLLMCSDILILKPDLVPVGSDQKQHIEITRDIANVFNKKYGQILVRPEEKILDQEPLSGIDGRKMSKSYNNTIPLFVEEKIIFKKFKKIKSDSTELGKALSTENDALFEMMQSFMDNENLAILQQMYANGCGRMETKQFCFDYYLNYFKKARENYTYFMANQDELIKLVKESSDNVKREAEINIQQVRDIVGIIKL